MSRPIEEIKGDLLDAQVALMYAMCCSVHQRFGVSSRIQELRQELDQAKKESANGTT